MYDASLQLHLILLNDTGQDLYIPKLVSERWTQQYNSIFKMAYRQGTVTASVDTTVKERIALAGNQMFIKLSLTTKATKYYVKQ